MKEYAEWFYKSKQWQQVRNVYMSSRNWICERCGEVATICHHRKYITPVNIQDQDVTLNLDNLEALCQDCHNKEHRSSRADVSKPVFDSEGNLIRAIESKEIKEYIAAVKECEKFCTPPTSEGKIKMLLTELDP